jgi:hypothetical protein
MTLRLMSNQESLTSSNQSQPNKELLPPSNKHRTRLVFRRQAQPLLKVAFKLYCQSQPNKEFLPPSNKHRTRLVFRRQAQPLLKVAFKLYCQSQPNKEFLPPSNKHRTRLVFRRQAQPPLKVALQQQLINLERCSMHSDLSHLPHFSLRHQPSQFLSPSPAPQPTYPSPGPCFKQLLQQ